MPTPTITQRLTALEAENAEFKRQIADMKYAIGDWNQAQLSRDEMERQKAAGEVPTMPDGDHPVRWGARWGRFAIDDAVDLVGDMRTVLFAEDGTLVQIRQDIEQLQSVSSGNAASANQLAAAKTQLEQAKASLSEMALVVANLIENAENAATSPPAASQVRAALKSMGADFADDGTLSGFKLLSSGAPEGDFFGYLGVNDGAFRVFSGIRAKIGGKWPDVDVNRKLPVIMGPVVERDGAVSWDYDPPLLGTDPNPRPSKTFLIYLAGFIRGIGPRNWTNVGKYIDIGSFEAGRGFRFFTRRTGSQYPDIDVAHGFDADNVNPNFVKVGGQLRRLTVGVDGRPDFGAVVDEDQ